MERKFFWKTLVATALAITSFVMPFASSCDGKRNHSYGEWKTVVESTCNQLETQKRVCEDCGQEDYKTLEGYEEHKYSEWELVGDVLCNTVTTFRRTCSVCGKNDYNYEGEVRDHSYLDLQYDAETSELYFACEDCEYENRLKTSKLYPTDGNGQVEIVAIENNRAVVKPVANDGYYFLKWEATYSGEVRDVYYSVLQTYPSPSYEYKAIFTNDESLIQPVFFEIEVENDLEVEVEYLPYVNKECQQISYYIHENEDLVLSGDYSLLSLNNVISHVSQNNVETLPYCMSGRGYLGFEDCDLQTVYLNFSDIRNKCLLKLDEIGIVNEEIISIYDKNEKVTINTEKLCRTGVFESWTDEEGNILSTDEEFEFTVTDNTTVYLNVNKYDISFYYNNGYLYFEINEDGTLSLHGFSVKQFETVEIPSVIDGKTVTGIGTLRVYGFSGTLIIPDSVVNIEPNTFKYFEATVGFSSERSDLEASDFYGCSKYVKFDFSETMIQSLATNELRKLTNSQVEVAIVFESVMDEGVLGYYTAATQNITVKKLQENQLYNRNILNVLVHELRHYYQSICIGEVAGLGLTDLTVLPTGNQLGAWKYLDYTDPSKDYDKYYYNAREIDAREYAEKIVGFAIEA